MTHTTTSEDEREVALRDGEPAAHRGADPVERMRPAGGDFTERRELSGRSNGKRPHENATSLRS